MKPSETQKRIILAQIDVCLAEGEDESEWNWGALAHFCNSRWNLGIREKDMKSAGRDFVDELLINKARTAIRKIKIEGAEQMLDEEYGIKTAASWCLAKFGVEPELDQVEDLTIDETIDIIVTQAIKKYDEKEAVYPVMAGHVSSLSSPRLRRCPRKN